MGGKAGHSAQSLAWRYLYEMENTTMSGDEEYVYDEESGEWMAASDLAAKQAASDKV